MTPFQRKIMDFILAQWSATGVSPTYQEIADGIGASAKSSVHRAVQKLIARGWLIHTPIGHRTLRPAPGVFGKE